jgi:hypothetical protein
MEENFEQNKTALRRSVRQFPQQPEEKKERIVTWMAVCMIIVALFIDAIQLILTLLLIGVFICPVISVVSYFVFWVWFKMLGVSFLGSPKKFGTMGATIVGEIFLSFLPVFTAGITTVIVMTKAEDKLGPSLGKLLNSPKKL